MNTKNPEPSADKTATQQRRPKERNIVQVKTPEVVLHLKKMGHSFQDSEKHIWDREDNWFTRDVKETIYIKN